MNYLEQMNQAQNLMRALVDQTQTIDQVAEIFLNKFSEFLYELSKIINSQFEECNSDRKGICIQLICTILKKSVQKHCESIFSKGLAQRLRFFLQDLSKDYVSQGVALNVSRNVDSLKYAGIFCDDYFEKLQQLTKKIRQKSTTGNLNQTQNSSEQRQRNYTRTFLLNYEKICQIQPLKLIYETYVTFIKVENDGNIAKYGDVDEFNMKFQNSLNLSSRTNLNEFKGPLEQSLAITEAKRIQKLEQVIKQCHLNNFNLREMMRKELKKREQNIVLQLNLERPENQSKIGQN